MKSTPMRMHIILGAILAFSFTCALPELNLRAQETAESDEPEQEGEETSPSEKSMVSLSGRFKDLFTYYRTRRYSETGAHRYLIANLSRLRLSPELNLSDRLLVHVDLDNEIIAGTYLKSREFDSFWRYSQYNDLVHMSWEPWYGRKLYYRVKVHRAYAKLVLGDFTVTAGRQQIRFGSGRLWNPLDILNPISPTSIEGAEEQKGTDAIRLEYYPTEKTEIALIVDQKRVNDDWNERGALSYQNTNALGRLKTTIVETEIAAIGGRIARRSVGGVDVSTNLADGLLRGSALYNVPDSGKKFLIGGAGYEYNFASGLFFLIEYFYNQNGMNYHHGLRRTFEESIVSGISEGNFHRLANQFLTYNQHYAGMVLGYDLTPLVRIDFFTVYDFQGRGMMLIPSLKYNPLQNMDLSLGVFYGLVLEGAPHSSDFEEFDRNPFVYASLQWYF